MSLDPRIVEHIVDVARTTRGRILVVVVPDPAWAEPYLAAAARDVEIVRAPPDPVAFADIAYAARARPVVVASVFAGQPADPATWRRMNLLRERLTGGRPCVLLFVDDAGLHLLETAADDLRDHALVFSAPPPPPSRDRGPAGSGAGSVLWEWARVEEADVTSLRRALQRAWRAGLDERERLADFAVPLYVALVDHGDLVEAHEVWEQDLAGLVGAEGLGAAAREAAAARARLADVEGDEEAWDRWTASAGDDAPEAPEVYGVADAVSVRLQREAFLAAARRTEEAAGLLAVARAVSEEGHRVSPADPRWRDRAVQVELAAWDLADDQGRAAERAEAARRLREWVPVIGEGAVPLPGRAQLGLRLAREAERTGRPAEALATADAVLALLPDPPPTAPWAVLRAEVSMVVADARSALGRDSGDTLDRARACLGAWAGRADVELAIVDADMCDAWIHFHRGRLTDAARLAGAALGRLGARRKGPRAAWRTHRAAWLVGFARERNQDPAGAVDAYRDALAALADLHGADLAVRAERVVTRARLGAALRKAGRAAEASLILDEAVELAQEVASSGTDAEHWHRAALPWAERAAMREGHGDPVGALRDLDASLSLGERAVATDPEAPVHRWDLAMTLAHRAELATDASVALTDVTRGLDLLASVEDALAGHSGLWETRGSLLADRVRHAATLPEARDALGQARASFLRATADPSPDAVALRCRWLGDLAVFAHERGLVKEARRLLEEAVAASRTGSARPDAPPHQLEPQMVALENLGVLLHDERAFTKSKACFEEAASLAVRTGDETGARRLSAYAAREALAMGADPKAFASAVDAFRESVAPKGDPTNRLHAAHLLRLLSDELRRRGQLGSADVRLALAIADLRAAHRDTPDALKRAAMRKELQALETRLRG